ncbi:hypothetical protein [Hyphomicrobium sp.]|uniref:hypothetical protein n=1 Tax=Hyphomicrobium sp. TaxID=82 RepID=UPI003F713434
MTDDADNYTDDANSEGARRGPAVLRLLTLVAGGLEVTAFTLAAHLLVLSDAASEDHALLILAPLFGLTIPGLMLALADRAHAIALAMVVLALPAAGFALSQI